MKKRVLSNGLQVLYEKKEGNSVAVQVMVKVGSNQENNSERGIAHFLEHVLFEGTPKRPTNKEIANEIEKIGGEFNAYTTNERTCFYIKVLKKHFSKAVEILADILQNPLFLPQHVRKERNVVLKEIDMINDEPGSYQWILLQRALFDTHPAKNPTYGSKNVIRSLTPEKVRAFYEKHYVPSNMTIAIVGDIQNWEGEVKKRFTKNKSKAPKRPTNKSTILTRNKIRKQKRKTSNSYFTIGFRTVSRKNKDSYVLDVMHAILGRGQSGKLFVEVRSKLGLAYDVGSEHTAELDFGMFAGYAIVDRKNIPKVRDMILQEIRSLENCSQEDLNDAKTFIEGNYLLAVEDVQKKADYILFWDHVKDAKLEQDYIKNIKRVTLKDVQIAAKKYFKHYVMAVVEGK